MKSVAYYILAGIFLTLLAGCGQTGPRYTDATLGVSINHPASAKIHSSKKRRVQFVVPAADGKIDGGFTLTIKRMGDVPVIATLGAYANAILRRAKARGIQVVGGLMRVSIGDNQAARFRYRTAAGHMVTAYLFAPRRGAYYRVTVTTRGSNNQARALDMLKTLSFSPPAGWTPPKVQVALLETPADGTRAEFGCDTIVFERFQPPVRNKPLTMALETLFSLYKKKVRGHRNFIARTRETLRFDHAVRNGHTARIYLVGKLSGLRGVCDNPRAAIQIRQTALQVPGIKHVQLFLNDKKTDLRPDARGRRTATASDTPRS